MEKNQNQSHWTARGTEDFQFRIAADFILQLEKVMEKLGINQAKLAKRLGVTEGRVSQVFNNPGNLTLKKIVQYSCAVEHKVSIVEYDDGDAKNLNGPIHSEIFVTCWERCGKPSDFFALQQGDSLIATTAIATNAVVANSIGTISYSGSGTVNDLNGNWTSVGGNAYLTVRALTGTFTVASSSGDTVAAQFEGTTGLVAPFWYATTDVTGSRIGNGMSQTVLTGTATIGDGMTNLVGHFAAKTA